ncbi:MAG: ABC transporter permease [Oscillospiraceae bacterium]|nr:ABC transporter permease [Oscillospiraceae bacterium]
MSKLFYPKLAVTNIKKNGKFYFPYLLTYVGTISMFYIMSAISNNSRISTMPDAQSMTTIMNLGTIVIGIFSVIFLFYTHSFLMKRRKKELGLYNILGMEKKHLAKMLFLETAITSAAGLACGLGCGILFNKLIILILEKILHFDSGIRFEIPGISVLITLVLFAVISLLTLLSDFARIKLSNPIELLNGSSVGEKEPKTKIIMTLIGFACISTGYAIAIITDSPLDALLLFFLAVVLVIIGTYLIFTTGSIAILKLLKKNKKYYYKTSHFTSVSGMLYRMKQNAVGLANICVLSTMVLVMVSTTVCLYIGAEDTLMNRYPTDMNFEQYYDLNDAPDPEKIVNIIKDTADKNAYTLTDFKDYSYLSFITGKQGDVLSTTPSNEMTGSDVHILVLVTADEYNRLTGNSETLTGSDVLMYESGKSIGSSFVLFDQRYTVTKKLDSDFMNSNYSGYDFNLHYIVVADDSTLRTIFNEQKNIYGDSSSPMEHYIEFNLKNPNGSTVDAFKTLQNALGGLESFNGECREANRDSFYSIYGCFLFLGVFLGLLFTMAAVLIIYYKQISEGYDDKERYHVMQNVGMSKTEVKQSIGSQVLTVFFMPLIIAALHILASFKMITKLLSLFGLYNIPLFAGCSALTFLSFAVIYAVVYILTAKVYYKIVNA